MRNKIHKILGVSLTLMLALGLVAGFAVPVAGAETINEWYKFDYPVEGEDGDWFYDPDIYRIGEITEAINGDLYVHVEIMEASDHIFKSEDGGRTWADTGYVDVDLDPDTPVVPPGWVIDMVASSIDEDILYVTDGNYVYKTVDGGDEFTLVARDSLEEQIMGSCGTPITHYPITSIDVTYDDDDNPFLFIGTRESGSGTVYWIGEAGYPSTWSDLDLDCYAGGGYDALAVGCAPDWADSHETYVVVTNYSDTHVVYTIGVTCSWIEFAELLQNCNTADVNPADGEPDGEFGSLFASRIGFPDDWEDTETLFVGIVDLWFGNGGNPGGDVYRVTDGSALDLNVEGITAGCVGTEPATDIISLDIMGDMDEAQLIAGAYGDTNVYYSYDGGWEWNISDKDPTGEWLTYVIWYDGSALAVTAGCEAAVSLSCVSDDVEDVGEAWNQISLIATYIEMVRWLSFSPGYVCEDSETMYMLTYTGGNGCTTNSLFRHDGTYWERVFLADEADYGGYDAYATPWWWVEVSPDFNETNCVYVVNGDFEIFRTTDAGCSWTQLTFPCVERPYVYAMVVIDEDTVIIGGEDEDTEDPMVYKTTRHGARPWDEYELPEDVCYVKDFALEPGYEDPGTLILGDRCSNVCISEDGGEEWELVDDLATLVDGSYKTWVVFDPTSDIIYAAAGEVIARCVIDRDEDWADQTWDELCDNLDYAYGIAAAGDTALYVVDNAEVNYPDINGLGLIDSGGVLRSLNPDAEDEADVVFERIGPGLENNNNGGTELRELWLTCDTSDDGCAENVLWSLERIWANHENVWVYEDTLAAPIVLDMPLDAQKLTTTDQATLSWDTLCGADCYEVALWKYCPECPDDKLTIGLCLESPCAPGDTVACGSPIAGCVDINGDCCPCTEDDCIVIDGLDSGTKYYWQVRVCQGQPYLSKWSEERIFFTALPAVDELCSPICGGQDIILTTNFSWDAVAGATGYDIELATTETFTAGVVTGSSTVNAWVTEPLEYATTYYWRVRAEKDGVVSDWTVCIFTTLEAAVPAPPPVVVEPTPPAPVVPTPIIEFPPTPSWVWAIIGIGTALVVVVIVLTVRTRRPPA